MYKNTRVKYFFGNYTIIEIIWKLMIIIRYIS